MRLHLDSKAVSEVVGALLTVVIIVTAAGLIYTISHPFISTSIDNVNYINAIKNMAEVKEIIQRMKYGSEVATSKTIQLNGGSISNSKYFTVKVSTPTLPPGLQGNPHPNINAFIHAAGDDEVEWEVHTLNIETAGREVVFESGIFLKEYGTVNPFPVSEPDLIVTNDTLYLSLYDFYGNFSAGGSKVTVNFKHDFTTIFSNITSIEIESDFCQIWKKSLEEALNALSNPPADLVDNDCSDKLIRIEKTNGNLNLIVTRVEVS